MALIEQLDDQQDCDDECESGGPVDHLSISIAPELPIGFHATFPLGLVDDRWVVTPRAISARLHWAPTWSDRRLCNRGWGTLHLSCRHEAAPPRTPVVSHEEIRNEVVPMSQQDSSRKRWRFRRRTWTFPAPWYQPLVVTTLRIDPDLKQAGEIVCNRETLHEPPAT